MTHLDDLNAKARAAFTNRTPAPDPEPELVAQYEASTDVCHFLVSVFTDGAVLEMRRNEWDTFDPPVQLAAVPVSAWSGRAS
jgi:hypothetical protein